MLGEIKQGLAHHSHAAVSEDAALRNHPHTPSLHQTTAPGGNRTLTMAFGA
jgi:hypothetical protein